MSKKPKIATGKLDSGEFLRYQTENAKHVSGRGWDEGK